MQRFGQILNKDIEGQKTTAVMFGGIDDPLVAPTVFSQTNVSSMLTSGTYYIAFSWYNQYGETIISPESWITIGAGREIAITLPTKSTNADGANIYIGIATNSKTKQGTTTSTSYVQMFALSTTSEHPPIDNLTYEWVTPVQVKYPLPSGNNILGYVKLSDGTDALLIDSHGSAQVVPYSSTGSELFTANNPGNIQIRKRSAKEPFSGSTNVTHTFNTIMNGFSIVNDGNANLAFTIGTDTFSVQPGEVFDDFFDPFNNVTITTTVPYRAFGRG